MCRCVCVWGGVQQEASFLFLSQGLQDFNSEALISLLYFSFVTVLGLTAQPRLAWVSQSSCLSFLGSGITGMSQHPHFPLLKKKIGGTWNFSCCHLSWQLFAVRQWEQPRSSSACAACPSAWDFLSPQHTGSFGYHWTGHSCIHSFNCSCTPSSRLSPSTQW